MTYPKWTTEKLHIHSYPLKSILDTILAENAMVDMDRWTKKLPAAHFDSEGFRNGSRRLIKIRRISKCQLDCFLFQSFLNSVVGHVLNETIDLTQARQLLGQLLHTLQDFYSHSNWIELGKTDINERLGLSEDIGPVARPDQPACQNEGCVRKQVKCVSITDRPSLSPLMFSLQSLLQKMTLNKCPLVYYECKNNIRPEIIEQGLLTSGFSINQHNEDNEPIFKPIDVEKCSHGSVMDTSSHRAAIGGINKDTVTPIYSPHFDLQ